MMWIYALCTKVKFLKHFRAYFLLKRAFFSETVRFKEVYYDFINVTMV